MFEKFRKQDINSNFFTLNQLIEKLQQIDPKYRDKIIFVDDERLITDIWVFDDYPNIATVSKSK